MGLLIFLTFFFYCWGRETAIRPVSGSVEAACGLGLADAVVDLVETGTTMQVCIPLYYFSYKRNRTLWVNLTKVQG